MAKPTKKPKIYKVSIVGESHYRPAVKATDEGDYVDLVIEENNPHSKSGPALRVDNMDGDTVGYIPSDNWLYRAIVTEGKGCLARVDFKDGSPPGLRLEVQLGEEKVHRVQYGERIPQPAGGGGCLGILIGALVLVAYPLAERLA